VPRFFWCLPLAAVVAVISCGPGVAPKADGTTFPGVAFQPLTERDIEIMLTVAPAVKSELALARFEVEPTDPFTEGAVASLHKLVEGIGATRGVARAVSDYGSSWPELRKILYRVLAASTADGFERAGVSALAALEGDTTAAGRAQYRLLDETRRAVERVPRGNVEILRRHIKELAPFFSGLLPAQGS
jgi:hypothetical protein